MKKIVFTIASRRLEVDLEDEFVTYLHDDLAKSNLSLDQNNDIAQLLQAYLKSAYKDFKSEKHIKTLLNEIEESIWK